MVTTEYPPRLSHWLVSQLTLWPSGRVLAIRWLCTSYSCCCSMHSLCPASRVKREPNLARVYIRRARIGDAGQMLVMFVKERWCGCWTVSKSYMDANLWRPSTTSAFHVVQPHRNAVVRVDAANLDQRIWLIKKGRINKYLRPLSAAVGVSVEVWLPAITPSCSAAVSKQTIVVLHSNS